MKNTDLLLNFKTPYQAHKDGDLLNEAFTDACRILCRLGVTANYSGFYYTAYAVSLAVPEPERLQLVTKWLYPDVASMYGVSSDCVRKNIRRVCDIAWHSNRELLSEMAMHEIKKKPGISEFLAIIYAFLSF